MGKPPALFSWNPWSKSCPTTWWCSPSVGMRGAIKAASRYEPFPGASRRHGGCPAAVPCWQRLCLSYSDRHFTQGCSAPDTWSIKMGRNSCQKYLPWEFQFPAGWFSSALPLSPQDIRKAREECWISLWVGSSDFVLLKGWLKKQ